MPPLRDLTGLPFGSWTVLRRAPKDPSHHTFWICECLCGTVKPVNGESLRKGDSTSCGCEAAAKAAITSRTHGLSDIPEYHVWAAMKARCTNPNLPSFKNYGGRGITVCDAWKDSFEAFYRDMGPRDSPEHTLERRNNNLGYDKQNCYWALRKTQSRNTRANLLIAINEETHCLAEWLEILQMSIGTYRYRVMQGMPPAEALTTPLDHTRVGRTSELVPADIRMLRLLAEQGFPYSLLAQIFHISIGTVFKIIHHRAYKHI